MKDEIENLSSPKSSGEQNDLSNQQKKVNPQIKFSIVEKWKEIMNSIKEKTGIDGIYVTIFLSICVFFVYLGILGSLITSLVGTLYPGFSTIKAIQKNKNKKEWLTYWVVFGSFLIFDMFSNIIVKFIPFYFVMKILFLIWMFIPGSNGCRLVYEFLIIKVMTPLEQIFDEFFKEFNEAGKEIFHKVKGVKIMNDLINFPKKRKRMKKEGEQNKDNNISEKEIDESTNSKSVLITSSHSKSLINDEKKEEKKKEEKKEEKNEEKNEEKAKEEKEKEEHINLNKNLDEFRMTFSNVQKEENNNQELELSFEEEGDNKN